MPLPDNPADWTLGQTCWWFVGTGAMLGVAYLLYTYVFKRHDDR